MNVAPRTTNTAPLKESASPSGSLFLVGGVSRRGGQTNSWTKFPLGIAIAEQETVALPDE